MTWALASNLLFESRYLGDAVSLIKENSECQILLGTKIKAYAERSTHRGRRSGQVQSNRISDAAGREHVTMRFYVEGSTGRQGTVSLEMIEKPDAMEYVYLFVDIPGSPRVYLKREVPAAKPKKRLFSW